MDDHLARGRAAFQSRAWKDVYEQLTAARSDPLFELDDLEHLAEGTFLIGRDDEALVTLKQCHQEWLDRGETLRAIRCAFWIGMVHVRRGGMSEASGWFARAHRLAEGFGPDTLEQAYVIAPQAIQSLFAGDFAAAHSAAGRVEKVATAQREWDLRALAILTQGQSLVGLGRAAEGTAILDEVMVAVTAGEISPVVSGIVYCAVISTCQSIFDMRRAQDWTEALNEWCASQPEMVPYRGQCLVHRAQVLQHRGHWRDAASEAERARRQFLDAPEAGIGMAHYQLGELHRLRGDFDAAHDAYREASRWGHVPQPGVALLRLVQGQPEVAAASIRTALDDVDGPVERCTLLPAFVEIMLAIHDLESADRGAEELASVAAMVGAPLLDALAAYARGAVLLAAGDPRGALARLRKSAALFHELEAPYEEARVRVMIGMASLEVGDADIAELELDAARLEFEQLGAAPDLAAIDAITRKSLSGDSLGLTGREVEVLSLVAAGMTNREIAGKLVISEKTVARHISNIFSKLDVRSRTSATAFAYKHDLI
jgi:DNA-binding CsgD family transcriptional regulator